MREGTAGNEWIPAALHSISFDQVYQPAFQVERLQGWDGDISIDDVMFLDGFCPENGLVCEFEQGTCNWINQPNADYQWKRLNGGKTGK